MVAAALRAGDFEAEKDSLMDRSRTLMERYPLYPQLATAAV